MAGENALLPESAGYGVVLGIGFFFTFLMIGISWIQNRYTNFKTTSIEEFTSASKSVPAGLIASGIVSAWTWAATLLTSSAQAYKFGIAGPWWYAAGACVQVFLFAQNAAKLKLNAPNAHTYLEVLGERWGVAGHLTFMFFGLATNIIVSSMLILGGSATVTDLTGIPTLAACFLIPVGVCFYVLVGGMRSTLLCDYIHTSVLLCFILAFMFTVYTNSDKIGSPGAMYRLLEEAAVRAPVSGNAHGSYLTLRSKNGLIFGVINVIGNFGTVYNDQAYWQRAIASKPSSAVKAFTLGGTAWAAVPLGLATTLGLAAVALTTNPSFPGFPEALTAAEVSAGLPAPAAAAALLGKTGASMMLILLFLAVTSATSAELVAVSSIGAYDIYKKYFRPTAGAQELLRVDQISILVYGVFMGVLGLIWFYINISMGYLYELMGCIIGSAVCPIALGIMSRRANKWGCILGAWIGLGCGLIAWLVTAATLNDGKLTIETTGTDYPMLAGNLAALGVGSIISVASTFIWPENYQFEDSKFGINVYNAHAHTVAGAGAVGTTSAIEGIDAGLHDATKDNKEKDLSIVTSRQVKPDGKQDSPSGTAAKPLPQDFEPEMEDPIALKKAFRFSVWFSIILALVLLIIIPLPLFFSSHIFSLADFTAWIAVAFIWAFYAIGVVVIYPIWESRMGLKNIAMGIWKDLRGIGRH